MRSNGFEKWVTDHETGKRFGISIQGQKVYLQGAYIPPGGIAIPLAVWDGIAKNLDRGVIQRKTCNFEWWHDGDQFRFQIRRIDGAVPLSIRVPELVMEALTEAG